MSKTYKYTDDSNAVVHVIDEDGTSRMSMLASAVPPGDDGLPPEILPADPLPVVVPGVIDAAQGQYILIEMTDSEGVSYWDKVKAYIAAIPSKKKREQAETAVMRTQRWRKDSVTLNQMMAAIGITEALRDDMFIAADQVVF